MCDVYIRAPSSLEYYLRIWQLLARRWRGSQPRPHSDPLRLNSWWAWACRRYFWASPLVYRYVFRHAFALLMCAHEPLYTQVVILWQKACARAQRPGAAASVWLRLARLPLPASRVRRSRRLRDTLAAPGLLARASVAETVTLCLMGPKLRGYTVACMVSSGCVAAGWQGHRARQVHRVQAAFHRKR